MGAHMKTTIDIADALLIEAKALASEQHTTLREIVEEGLRQAIARRKTAGHFELKDVSIGGRGLKAPWTDEDWAAIRAASYEPEA